MRTISLFLSGGIFALAVFLSGLRSEPDRKPEENPLRRVELLVLETGLRSKVRVGLFFDLAPGWYLYWLNPGDAGLAPQVRWQIPAGFAAGKLNFPTPQKFVHAGSVAFGYEDELLLLCEITAPTSPPSGSPPVITAVVDWMACRESCVQGRETVSAVLQGVSPDVLGRAKDLEKNFSSRFPRAVSAEAVAVKGARLIRSGNGWSVEVALSGPDAAAVSDFFPYPLPDFVIDHARLVCREGRISVPLAPARVGAPLSYLDGLLIIGGRGHEISIPVQQ
jgi:thiol:disulfide interchange protein DsbD